MKKFIMIVAALTITLSANAQIKFGVKAGLNVSQFSGGTVKSGENSTDFEASGGQIGFHAGVFANVVFSPLIGLQPEVVFSLQGEKESVDGGTLKMNLGYINVPVLLDIKPIPNFSILVGPQFGLNVTRSMSSGGISVSGSTLDDALEADGSKINPIDIAVVLGVQYTLFDHLALGVRYNFGFTSVVGLTDEAKRLGLSMSGANSRVIQISAGWTF